jgi:predicted ATP-dependent protease
MTAPRELSPEQLRRRCDPASLPFTTTAEVAPLEATIGQPRALGAISFGLDIDGDGYNLFAVGPSGTGKRTTLRRVVEQTATNRPAGDDWVYLFNFADERRPIAVRMPVGRAPALARDVAKFVDDARRELSRAFESDDYQRRTRTIATDLEAGRERIIETFREYVAGLGLSLETTASGMMTVPVVDGKRVTPEAYEQLPEDQRDAFRARSREVDERAPGVMASLRALERDARERIVETDREIALFAVGHLVDALRQQYGSVERLGSWFDAAREDIIERLPQFRGAAESDSAEALPEAVAMERRQAREMAAARYEVNVFIHRDAGEGAPVVVEDSPSFHNLFGRIEYTTNFGVVTTDHRFLRAGAVHRANGGYLLLQAADVAASPYAWDRLKETLREARARIENVGAQYPPFPTQTLEPEPIAVRLKVILIGPVAVYQALYLMDEEFRKLFKVPAEFDLEMPWDGPDIDLYASFIGSRVRDGGLRPFDRTAVARIVEQGARIAGDRERLSTRFSEIVDLVTESSYWAGEAGSEIVSAEHVDRAIRTRVERGGLVEDRIHELIEAGSIRIETEGTVVGQVNGLAVLTAGGRTFGQPIRITATSSVGRGEVIHIDRETAMSGPIHTKGFLILTGFLQHHYGRERPLALRASLAVEQSYGAIEGDSASLAELCALLAELGEVGVRQGIAVTGSIDQHGSVQPIGGVNEKIEGFFRVCARRGLAGDQGVIIPETNVRHLMLDESVVNAVREGRFHVWPVQTVDNAIELLASIPTGSRGPDGVYPAGTLHRLVDDRMARLTERAKELQPTAPAHDPSAAAG